MPQVFQVLRCYKCLVFQVHQTKKTNKWQCKMCGEKQSVKRHYGIGSGKDCRLHVQKLNTIRGDTEELNQNILDSDQNSISNDEDCNEEISKQNAPEIQAIQNSKWKAFIDESLENLDDSVDSDLEDQKLTLVNKEMKTHYNKRRKISSNKPNQKDKEITFESNLSSNSCYYPLNTTNEKNKNFENYRASIDYNSNENKSIIQLDKTVISNKRHFNAENRHLCSREKETPRDNNIKHSTSVPANSKKIVSSKWANYIDENEESLDTSNEEIFPSTQDVSSEFPQGNAIFKDNKPVNVTEQSDKIKNIKFESLKENFNKEISGHRERDNFQELKMNDETNKNQHKYDVSKKNSVKHNQANMFSLCDDNDLDDILDF